MRGSPEVPQGAAERRQLTVLFCDLVGSTALSDTLDPEAFRELVLAYQQAVGEVVARHRGHVAQYLGDGMLVYFGYPAAQDDDAERAVRCGYDILSALNRLDVGKGLPTYTGTVGRESLPAIRLSARIGIHTGTVVVGQMGGAGKSETLAMGAATNVAARLQAIAQPQTVVISGATHKLVPGMFITRELGTQTIRGIDKPLAVYEVVQPSGVRTRLEAAAHLTPFVGRQQELALLMDRWLQATEGQGQAVLLSAEPGIGKSRLLLTFHQQIKDTAHSWLDCRASPMVQGSAYQPIIELMHRGLVLKEGDIAAIKLQKLEEAMDRIGQDKAEAVPLLAPLLSLELPAPYEPSPYGPELKRRKTMDLLNTWLLALAAHQPLILAFEDLHWADPSTIESLTRLLEQIPSHTVLLLFTARPEFQPNWPVRAHMALVALQPLRVKETGEMLDALTQHKSLPEPVKERILKQAGGVPLFVEEITKALLESGQLVERDGRLELTGSLDQLEIPATLQDSLMARLDRLGEAKAIAQVCAVIGREIPYKLLALVADTDEPVLQQHLKALTDAQLLYPRGTPPEASYLFKHALIQDTAYNSLLKSTRQKLHARIAAALERHFAERARAEPAEVAEHFERAGATGQAVRYYKAAAESAARRAAISEALSLSERALALLATLPRDVERDRLEFALLAKLIYWIGFTRGFGHPDLHSLLRRARGLFASVDDPFARATVLASSYAVHNFAGEYEEGARFAQDLAGFGTSIGVPVIEASGYANGAWSDFMRGRFSGAMAQVEKALTFRDRESARAYAELAGAEPVVVALLCRSWSRWFLGYADDALASAREAIRWTDELGIPLASCMAACWGTPYVRHVRGEPRAAQEACVAAAELSQRYGFKDGQNSIGACHSIALGRLGRLEEGLTLYRQVVKATQDMQTYQTITFVHAEMAAGCLNAGRLDDARGSLDRAFELMETHNERFYEAELHRLKGELLLAEAGAVTPAEAVGRHSHAADSKMSAKDCRPTAAESEAEACFHKALEVSRSQQAKSLELRAATSLARLWQKQNRITEARDLLQPVYDWFTEGFDTPDLKDAMALLTELQA